MVLLIGPLRRERFPEVDDVGEGIGLPYLDQRVEVVGHEAPGDQTVALDV